MQSHQLIRTETHKVYPTQAGTAEDRNRIATLQYIQHSNPLTSVTARSQIGEEIMNPQAAKAARA